MSGISGSVLQIPETDAPQLGDSSVA